LERAVHFLSPDGADTVLVPGVYGAEAKDEKFINVTAVHGGATITIQAEAGTHEEQLSAPGALTVAQDEDLLHVVLLMPGGKTLDAVGTFSGVSTRAPSAMVPLQPQQLREFARRPVPAPVAPPTAGLLPAPLSILPMVPIRPPLSGWVDMHTHPMSHLAFGRKLLHGAPDIQMKIPAGTRNCNPHEFRAQSINDALGNCNSTHGGWGLDNGCGNYIRAIVVSDFLDGDFAYKLDHNIFNGGNLHGDHRHEGIETSPSFLYWPHQTSKTHQQMWWEWIKRAYQQGGLRVMVALSVNSELLATVIDGDQPKDDMNSADEQIDEIKYFVSRHPDFMEIAYTSADLRRIVSANKLAVILGMEVDNIGNFNKPYVPGVWSPDTLPYPGVSGDIIRFEINRLYVKGVRYIFPIHLVDNAFGGTAVYDNLFNYANKYSTLGNLYTVQSSTTIDPLIMFRLSPGADGVGNLLLKGALDLASGIPYPPAFNANPFDSRFCLNPIPFSGSLGCWDKFKFIRGLVAPDPRYITYAATPGGHVNVKGLTEMGKIAVKQMMQLGMLIDIDHMSEKSINDTLTLAEGPPPLRYPINIGHNGIRGQEVGKAPSERGASRSTIGRVAALGGVFGVGTADIYPQDFIASFKAVEAVWSAKGLRPSVAIGTDANGMERLPRQSPGLNSAAFYSAFPKATTGSRTWDYTTEGVAHYGLMADFVKDVKEKDVAVYDNLMKSAEYFAQMWEKAEAEKVNVH
jgi:microsomal dipeptidase-like Zn-dependent dipeptidase